MMIIFACNYASGSPLPPSQHMSLDDRIPVVKNELSGLATPGIMCQGKVHLNWKAL